MTKSVLLHSERKPHFGVVGGDAPCDDDKVDHVAMHEALVVPVCARQMIQEESFMWKDYTKAKTMLRTVRVNYAYQHAPFRFFFVPALTEAPSGIGMGPTSSSLSSSS